MGILGQAAVDYAEAGHFVLPLYSVRPGGSCACDRGSSCSSPGKHPISRLVPRGSRDASDDPERVASWWRQIPDANVGLATGHGFFVIDCDRKPLVDGTAAFLLLHQRYGQAAPETVASTTGSGGAHFLYALPEEIEVRNQQQLLVDGAREPGIDVRGAGGYVVVPPSVHASGSVYVWARDILGHPLRSPAPWLLQALATHANSGSGEPTLFEEPGSSHAVPCAPSRAPATSSTAVAPPPAASAASHVVERWRLDEIRAALEYCPANTDRETWMHRVTMPLHDFFGGSEEGFKLWNEWCRRGEGLWTPNGNPAYPGEREARRQWRSLRSAHRNPKGIRTLFEYAMTLGFTGGSEGSSTVHVPAPPEGAPQIAATITVPPAQNGRHAPEIAISPDLIVPAAETPPAMPALDLEELKALGGEPKKPGPFPESVTRDLQGPLGSLVSWILDCSRRRDPVLALGAALAFTAAAGGRRLRGPDGARPQLCLAVIAPSGSGKDRPQECVSNLVASHPNLCCVVLDDAPSHPTQLDARLLAHRGQALMMLDEYGSVLGRWLKSSDMLGGLMSRSLRTLASYGWRTYHLAEVSERHPSRSKNLAAWDAGIWAPSLTLAGFTTPEQFYGTVTADALVDGFMGRHILCVSEGQHRLKSPTSSTLEPPRDVVEWIEGVEGIPIPSTSRNFAPPNPAGDYFDRQNEVQLDPLEIRWASASVERDWFRLTSDIDRQGLEALRSGQSFRAALLRRMPGQIVNLALVLAFGESVVPIEARVRERHIQLAFRLIAWNVEHLAWVFRHGTAEDLSLTGALKYLFEAIEEAAPDKFYFTKAKAAVRAVLPRILPTILSDPRFVATPRWARVRPLDDLTKSAREQLER